MTRSRAAPVIIIAGALWVARLFFAGFFLFGPAVTAAVCTYAASGSLSKYTLGLLGTKTAALVCGATTAVTGSIGMAITLPFGEFMAMFIGITGWLIVGGAITLTNLRILAETKFVGLKLGLALIGSEVPFVDAVPGLFGTVWSMYADQIKRDKERYAAWEKRTAAQRARAQQARLMQFQATQQQMAMADAANDAEIEQEELEEQQAEEKSNNVKQVQATEEQVAEGEAGNDDEYAQAA